MAEVGMMNIEFANLKVKFFRPKEAIHRLGLKGEKSKINFALLAGIALVFTSCATEPVETDPEKAAIRYRLMEQDCYKRGGVWNEKVKTCLGANKNY